ncbi:MAG: WhiB family transcriptional regulator [Chloroflexi bacterium]|nr:WhiB family transcriptional regulator [Chloroflexota bacterium]
MNWRRLAACRDHDTRLWYPDTFHANSPRLNKARAICATCPAKNACYREAVTRKETWGMWGGVWFHEGTSAQRRRRARKAAAA